MGSQLWVTKMVKMGKDNVETNWLECNLGMLSMWKDDMAQIYTTTMTVALPHTQ
jgi:hypothetical protein